MKSNRFITGAAAFALAFAAAPSFAQSDIVGTRVVDESIEDLERDVSRDFARSDDAQRFGPETVSGLKGSVSLSYAGRTGNSDSQDLSIGARMTHGQGNFVQSVGLLVDFGENDDGTKDTEEVYAIYDANYYVNDKLYGFAIGRVKSDALAEAGEYDRDGFLGFGPGYRIVNNDSTTWRVQAGVGVSYTREAATDNSTTEVGYIASSRVFHRFNDTIFLTNDTDVLTSDEAGLRAINDLGVNYKMTDVLSTRVSYLTEYQENRAIRTDNKLGVSLVMGF